MKLLLWPVRLLGRLFLWSWERFTGAPFGGGAGIDPEE